MDGYYLRKADPIQNIVGNCSDRMPHSKTAEYPLKSVYENAIR